MVQRTSLKKPSFLLVGFFSFIFGIFGVGYVFEKTSSDSLFGSQPAYAQKDGGDPGCGCTGGGGGEGGGSSSNSDGAQAL